MPLFTRIRRALWRPRPTRAPRACTKAHTAHPAPQPIRTAPTPDACTSNGALALLYLQALARKDFDGATEAVEIHLGVHHPEGLSTPQLFAWVSRPDASLCTQLALAGQDHHQVWQALQAENRGCTPPSGALFSRSFVPITGSAHAKMAARAALLADLPPDLRAIAPPSQPQEDQPAPPADLRLRATSLHTTRRLCHILTQTSQDILARQHAQLQSALQAMEDSRPAEGP